MKANLLPIRPSAFNFRVLIFFKKAKIHVLGMCLVHQKVFIMDVHGVPTDNISDQYRKHVQLINAMRERAKLILLITTTAASDKLIQS